MVPSLVIAACGLLLCAFLITAWRRLSVSKGKSVSWLLIINTAAVIVPIPVGYPLGDTAIPIVVGLILSWLGIILREISTGPEIETPD